jgi:hypothetical protein
VFEEGLILLVMPALVAGTHALPRLKGVDGRDEPGHDGKYNRKQKERPAGRSPIGR